MDGADIFIGVSGPDLLSSDWQLKFGEFAENITTRGVSLRLVAILDRIRIGETELEITQIGKKCHSGCAVFQEVGACVMPKEGLFARVIKGGVIEPNMSGTILLRPFSVWVVTCSDRAYKGVYEDRSGPQIEEIFTKHYAQKRDHLDISRRIIPDDPGILESIFNEAVSGGVDLVITTGGTGIGPRDFTPDVTSAFCERLLPGLMEHARISFGARKPGALLSRGVAGVRDKTFIINFPGSVRAASEYSHLLLTHWDHIRRMIHGIDRH
jgi:molybdenum cofactor synthesis domain-containing protein